jgi:hypothetical protein
MHPTKYLGTDEEILEEIDIWSESLGSFEMPDDRRVGKGWRSTIDEHIMMTMNLRPHRKDIPARPSIHTTNRGRSERLMKAKKKKNLVRDDE